MRTLFCVCCLALLFTAPLRGQERLLTAHELYSAASYDEALAVLSRLDTPATQGADRMAVNQYRALCLLALGRANEAERAIEAVVAADPLYRPADADASPRLRSVFATVRQRVLPELVLQQYSYAKAAYDRQEFAIAAASFDRVVTVLADPDLRLAAARPPLSDLRTLATGFRDLSAKAAEPMPAPRKLEETPLPMAPVPPSRKPFYTGNDGDVTPPVAIRQTLPAFPRDLLATRGGMLEVLINEDGQVETATMRTPINPRYDAMVIGAAKAWRYQPGMLGGVPVKYRKVINISVKPGA
jgi:tetratricopeptide (TPR) repeat protein